MPINERLGTSDTITFTKTSGATKVVRDGFVGVVVSGDYGSGWFTWHHNEALLFDPEIVVLLEKRSLAGPEERAYYNERLTAYIDSNFNVQDYSVESLRLRWVPVNTKFVITEYDGRESITTPNDFTWLTA